MDERKDIFENGEEKNPDFASDDFDAATEQLNKTEDTEPLTDNLGETEDLKDAEPAGDYDAGGADEKVAIPYDAPVGETGDENNHAKKKNETDRKKDIIKTAAIVLSVLLVLSIVVMVVVGTRNRGKGTEETTAVDTLDTTGETTKEKESKKSTTKADESSKADGTAKTESTKDSSGSGSGSGGAAPATNTAGGTISDNGVSGAQLDGGSTKAGETSPQTVRPVVTSITPSGITVTIDDGLDWSDPKPVPPEFISTETDAEENED